MGCSYKAKCRDCGTDCTVDDGPGMFTSLLRCDKCGHNNHVSEYDFDISEFSKAAGAVYEQMLNYPVLRGAKLALPERPTVKELETLAAPCMCGGKYSSDAPPRCPKCFSTNLEIGDIRLYYD